MLLVHFLCTTYALLHVLTKTIYEVAEVHKLEVALMHFWHSTDNERCTRIMSVETHSVIHKPHLKCTYSWYPSWCVYPSYWQGYNWVYMEYYDEINYDIKCTSVLVHFWNESSTLFLQCINTCMHLWQPQTAVLHLELWTSITPHIDLTPLVHFYQ